MGRWGRDTAWLFWWGPLQPPAASQSPQNTLKQPLQKRFRGRTEASSQQLGERAILEAYSVSQSGLQMTVTLANTDHGCTS